MAASAPPLIIPIAQCRHWHWHQRSPHPCIPKRIGVGVVSASVVLLCKPIIFLLKIICQRNPHDLPENLARGSPKIPDPRLARTQQFHLQLNQHTLYINVQSSAGCQHISSKIFLATPLPTLTFTFGNIVILPLGQRFLCHCMSLYVTVYHCLPRMSRMSLYVTVCHCMLLFVTVSHLFINLRYYVCMWLGDVT